MTKTYPFSAYIFDCDGTLAASMKLHHAAWEYAVCQQYPNWAFPWKFFCSLGGMTTGDTCEILDAQYGFKLNVSAVKRDSHEFLDKHLEEVLPIPEVCNYAKKLAAAGTKLAVASGGYRNHVLRILKAIGVAEIFPHVVTVEDVKNCKPAPDLFLLAAEKLGVPAENCCVIEDSPKGFDAAEAAGMSCVMCWPF